MRRPDDTLDPLVERELAALDAALAGEPVDPDLTGLAELAVAARAARPVVSDDFASSLDSRVAGGFPRPPRRIDRVVAPVLRLRARASRRMLLPALGAAATVLVGLVVVASMVGGGGSSAPDTKVPESTAAQPSLQQRSAEGEGGSAAGGAGTIAEPIPPTSDDELAPGRPRRVERQASLTLEAKSGEIDDVADGVIRATDAAGGIVVTSSVSSGDEGRGGATFALRVPTRRLDDALARLSKLGHVRSRTQNSQDVTGAFVSAQERLDAGLAERKGLLRQLARADTPNETASIRERLRLVQSEIASARAQVRRLRTRTDFSAISVTIEPGDSSGGASGGSSDGAWTPGDALDDAVRVLEVCAGVALVGAAVLLPFALLGLGAGIASRGVRRRRREQALETG
jgi:hypothetical protein